MIIHWQNLYNQISHDYTATSVAQIAFWMSSHAHGITRQSLFAPNSHSTADL